MDISIKFDEMNLKESILRGIYSYGFETPSAIQSRAILPLCQGKDVIAQAQSGTGKTATFIIGVLQQIDESVNEIQALVLAPTRELVEQIHSVAQSLSSFMNVRTYSCMGGKSIPHDIRMFRTGVHIVIGTPGRVLDMSRRNFLKMDHLRSFIIDEADEMFSIGFKEQLFDIIDVIPDSCQIGLFSATMNSSMLRLAEDFMKDPVHIRILHEEITLEGIHQYYVDVEQEEWKLDTLCDLYEKVQITQAIIYCNTRKTVEWLAQQLTDRNFSVSAFHAELSQLERDTLMRQFRSGQSRVFISTDVLSRGIDVQQVSVIFNYDLPMKKENYIHRIGRSGRYGRKGIAINFVTNDTISTMQQIQHYYNTIIHELPQDFSSL
jgi:translation initiation factor 4A